MAGSIIYKVTFKLLLTRHVKLFYRIVSYLESALRFSTLTAQTVVPFYTNTVTYDNHNRFSARISPISCFAEQ